VADVSHAAAEMLGMMRRGIVRARIEVLGEVERRPG
jgi:rare lipoprotein A (peptidoglycan hydrolase)